MLWFSRGPNIFLLSNMKGSTGQSVDQTTRAFSSGSTLPGDQSGEQVVRIVESSPCFLPKAQELHEMYGRLVDPIPLISGLLCVCKNTARRENKHV